MKQTAVEWYAEQEEKLILEFISKKINDVEYGLYRLELLNKAKEIEKQQIGEAYVDGYKLAQEPEHFFNDDRVKTLEKSIEYLLKRKENSCEHNYILTAEQGHRIIKCINCNNIQTI